RAIRRVVCRCPHGCQIHDGGRPHPLPRLPRGRGRPMSAREWQADALRPVPAAGEAATEDVIERAARVLAQLEPGEEWPSNAALGGNPTGTRDDEFRAAMLDQARDLARAGLLELPTDTEGSN